MFDRFVREPLGGVKIVPYLGESVDSMLRRFKKATQKGDVLADYRRHEFFVSRSVRRRQKSARARRRRVT